MRAPKNGEGVMAIKAQMVCGRYTFSPTQQAEAIKMIRLGAKSQAEIAELFNVDRSTHSWEQQEQDSRNLVLGTILNNVAGNHAAS